MDTVRMKAGWFGEELYLAATFYMGWDKKWEHESARTLSISVR